MRYDFTLIFDFTFADSSKRDIENFALVDGFGGKNFWFHINDFHRVGDKAPQFL